MNKKQELKILYSIRMCELKLEKISACLNGNKPALNREYNRILIEKAVLRAKLLEKKKLFDINKINIFSHKTEKKFICDYFKHPCGALAKFSAPLDNFSL